MYVWKWIGDIWQKETEDKYCEFHDQLTRDVTSQLECQVKCESKEGCVGIAYSHEPAHIDICFVCLDDSLSSITNQFAFYRRPGKIKRISMACKVKKQGLKFLFY